MNKLKVAAAGALLSATASAGAFELDSILSHKVDQDIIACYDVPQDQSQCVADVKHWNSDLELYPLLEIATLAGALACGYQAYRALRQSPETTESPKRTTEKPWPAREDLS